MYPRSFDYLAPTTISEAVSMLGADPEAKILGGGMSLVPMLKLRLLAPSTIIDLGGVKGLNSIDAGNNHVSIGAMVSHVETASHPSVRANAEGLGEAAEVTGDVQVRNWGTTCGSMAHADPAADQPAAALACGATLVATSVDGTREIPASCLGSRPNLHPAVLTRGGFYW